MRVLISCIFIFFFKISFGQDFQYLDIPTLKVEDFKGAKSTNSIENEAAFTTWSVFYNIKQVKKLDYKSSFVTYNFTILMRKELSWIDKKLLKDQKQLDKILDHERGHLILAYALANGLRKRMNKVYYGDYNKQSSIIFNDLFEKVKALQVKYDLETDHSNNRIEQKEWNSRLKKLLLNPTF